MQKNKLKIGLLVDEMALSAWKYRMLEIIQQSDYAEITLIVQNSPPTEQRQQSVAGKVASKFASRQLWNAIIRKVLTIGEQLLVDKPGQLPDASREIDSRQLLADIEIINVARQDGG